MAVKAIENITTTVTNPSHHLLNLGICSTLWYLFTHSNGEAVKVAAASVSACPHSCTQLHNVLLCTVYDFLFCLNRLSKGLILAMEQQWLDNIADTNWDSLRQKKGVHT